MRSLITASLLVTAAPVLAEPPQVMTDIAPVHSLVAQVMAGVGEPGLLIQPGVSPHGYALRPSEARMLSEADVVFWVGEGQTPWLHETLESLAPDAQSVELLDAPGTFLLPLREGEHFAPHDHGHEAHDHDHAHSDADHAEHGLEEIDPHAWLDPENARAWLIHIAGVLATDDPDHAETYRANAAEAAARVTETEADIRERLAGIEGGFVTFHDAYQYFESHFGLPAYGALSPSDATDPGPARLSALHEMVAEGGVVCLFSEPQFNPRQVATLASDLKTRTGVLDPLGVNLEAGPKLYDALLESIADGLMACLDRG